MNAKQKARQIAGVVDKSDNNAPDDSEVLIPKSENVKLAGKTYKIQALPLRYIREVADIAKINKDNQLTMEHYDKTLQVISRAIGEPDIAFIEENLIPVEAGRIIATAYRLSMQGMPNPQGGSKSGGGRGVKG